MNKKVKLLIVAKQIDGGTGTFLEQLLSMKKRFSNKYAMMALILEKPRFRKMKNTPLLRVFSGGTASDYYYALTPKRIMAFVREFLFIFRNINQWNPDMIVSIDTHCAFFVGLLKIIFPFKKYIATFHNNVSAVAFSKLPWWIKNVVRYGCGVLLNRFDAVVGVSNGVAMDVRAFFSLRRCPKTIYYGVVPNRIINKAYITNKYNKHNKHNKHTVVSIGRFAPQKDFDTLLYAFKATRAHCPNAMLYLLGDGIEKQRICTLVHALGLRRYVKMMNWEKPERYYRKADIFTLSSHYEGFPFVLLEAMSWGVPIVSTDVAYGPRELLGNGKYGTLTEHRNIDSLQKAMTDLLMDKKKQTKFALDAHKRSLEFQEQDMIRAYDELFVTLIV